MTNSIYDKFMKHLVLGDIDPGSDTFYMMLCTSSYTPTKASDEHRSDVSNEVTGTGYTAGGQAVACTPSGPASAVESLTFAVTTWPTATITARYAVIYKHRGGSSSADELVAWIDFGGNVSSTGANFTVTPTSALTFTN